MCIFYICLYVARVHDWSYNFPVLSFSNLFTFNIKLFAGNFFYWVYILFYDIFRQFSLLFRMRLSFFRFTVCQLSVEYAQAIIMYRGNFIFGQIRNV